MILRTLFMLCLSVPAFARSVYINGVKADGLAAIKLKNADVEIDAAGDIWISAKGYHVSVRDALPPKPVAAPMPSPLPGAARRYYVIPSTRGDAEWDVDVYINGQFIKRFTSKEAEPPLEVTRWIKRGENRLRLRATKQPGQPHSISHEDYIEISIDEQSSFQGRLSAQNLYRWRRTAGETGMFDNNVNITVP